MNRLFINIDVPELESAIEFYTKAFGLTVHRRFESDAAELHGFPTEIHLLVKPEGTPSTIWLPRGLPKVFDYRRIGCR